MACDLTFLGHHRGYASLPTRSQAAAGVFQHQSPALSPFYSLPLREAAKEASSARSAPGGKCSSGRLRSASAALCSVLMAPATARDAASVRTSPAVRELARLAAAARLLLGAGPAGCPPRLLLQPASGFLLPVAGAPPAVRSGGSRPRKFQSLGLREQRSARTPHARLARLRASSDCWAARRAPHLKRGWRLPCAHACQEGFPSALGRQGDTRSPSLSFTKGVAVARQQCE